MSDTAWLFSALEKAGSGKWGHPDRDLSLHLSMSIGRQANSTQLRFIPAASPYHGEHKVKKKKVGRINGLGSWPLSYCLVSLSKKEKICHSTPQAVLLGC